jgi:hypothetical protein
MRRRDSVVTGSQPGSSLRSWGYDLGLRDGQRASFNSARDAARIVLPRRAMSPPAVRSIRTDSQDSCTARSAATPGSSATVALQAGSAFR